MRQAPGHAIEGKIDMELHALLACPTALPTMPKVVALLMNELNREEPDLRKVSQLVNTDPGLTTRVLQLANSAFFQLSRRVGSVSEALAVLGLTHIRSLVSVASLSGAFKTVPGIDLQQFWRYSIDVARVSRSLAGVVHQNQGTAFTAGLIHGVGELVMHMGMPDEMRPIDDVVGPIDPERGRVEARILGYDYGQVGAGLARAWHFPDQIVDALQYQLAPFDNDAYEPLAGVVHLATWRARCREAKLPAASLNETFPDVVALALGLDIDAVLQQDPIDWTTSADMQAFM